MGRSTHAFRRPDSKRRVGLVAGIVVALGLAAAPSLYAAEYDAAVEPGWGYSIAHELMSPYCPGRTLAACTSPQAAELRQWIVLQEAAGASRSEVEEALYARFGDVIRSSPRPEGWGLAAHLLPYAALALGAGLVVFVLRRITTGKDSPSATTEEWAGVRTSPGDPDLEKMLDEELRTRDI